MVTYEVTAEVRTDLDAAYESYMRERHVPDVLATGHFLAANLARSAPGRFRIRYEARAEVTRRISGPLHAALRADLANVRFTTLPGPSMFSADFGDGLEQDEVSGRLALIYDTRDTEFNTMRGLYVETGAQLAEGERRYNRNCRPCHGALGTGTQAGPPLVHEIYEPSHHSDAAFRLAITRGVRAHHWSFGNMLPVPGLDSAAIAGVTAYVRWLQQKAGIQ